MIRRPPRSTQSRSSAASDVYKRQVHAVTVRADLPAGRYTYLVHLRDPSGRAEAAARAAELRVLAPLPPAFPGRKAVARALDWAGGRAGEVGVAVVDSRGEVTGLHAHATFEGASLVKAMLLVACLLYTSPSPRD